MLRWETVPSNYRHPRKKANLFPATAYSDSEWGVEQIIGRMCETVRTRSASVINVTFEKIEATWICIDKQYPGVTRSIAQHLMPAFTVAFVTVYPPERGTPTGRQNDLFDLRIAVGNPERCPFYSDDRAVFADRLLHTVGKCWVDSWKLMARVEGHPRRKWPVKLWIHGDPRRVWAIGEDDLLAELPGHPPVDETIIDQCFVNSAT